MCVFVVESCVCAGGLLRRSCCVCEGKTEADDGANVYAFAAAGCLIFTVFLVENKIVELYLRNMSIFFFPPWDPPCLCSAVGVFRPGLLMLTGLFKMAFMRVLDFKHGV